jgi:hypothetical protein
MDWWLDWLRAFVRTPLQGRQVATAAAPRHRQSRSFPGYRERAARRQPSFHHHRSESCCQQRCRALLAPLKRPKGFPNHPDERMVFAEAKTIQRRGFPRPLSRELDVPLEQFRDRRFHGDASSRDRAADEGSRLSCGIGSSQRKRAEEGVSVRRHSNRFREPSRSGGIPNPARRIGGIVAEPGEVIYLVLVRPDVLPNAHAEVPVLRRPP